ncbi:MAG TPA: hypothetical protein VJI96_05120 [Candidatus Andersenbacteria bacterium]|nr:hypothetical protein [Candidatus Andersenbacteria bacterium]
MRKNNTLYAFLLALVITTIWTFFNRYEYIGNNLFLFNTINIFPLVLWTLGLTILYIVHIHTKIKHPILFITVFYLVCIGLLEAFGYYVLNIRLNSDYPSLFNMGIIHAPVHMKVFYIVAGPLYILLTHALLKYSASRPSRS